MAWRSCAPLLAALATLGPTAARAQHCHVGPPDPGARGFEVSLRSERARFRTARYEGDYSGLFLRGTWASPRLSLTAAMPYYRLVRNGLGSAGFGDLALEGRGAFVATRDERAAAGALLTLSAPTGDSARDLGMGHWMLAPTAWTRLTRDRFTLEARLGYGRALGSSTRHRHAPGKTPIVDPMNESELEGALSAVARAHRRFQTRLAVYGATPLLASDGAARAAVSFAGDLLVEPVRLSIEAHLPWVGDPFTGKLAAELGFRF